MKKIVLSVALIFSATYLIAQDAEVVNLFVSQKQYEKAKTEVDKWLAKPKLKDKDKATAYLWQLAVNSQIALDSSLSLKYPGAGEEGLDAFNKYRQIDPELKQYKEERFDGSLINISNSYALKGNNYWKSKTWDSAFKYFAGSERISELRQGAGLSSNIDTSIVLYTAFAAHNSKLYDSALKYYSKLADIKMAGPDYKDIYKFLIEYSAQQKNDADFKKYLALAKELYPNDSAEWSQYEMASMTANASLSELTQKYQQDVAAGASQINENKLITYAEAFATNDSAQLKDVDSAQRVQLKLTAAQAYGKAFDLNSSNGLYAFGAGYYYFYAFRILDDRYHTYVGESAALKAKRTEIAKEEMVYADSSAAWLEKAFAALSAKPTRERIETSNLNNTVNFLATIYQWKRDRTKADGNTGDYDKYDALYKKYDALYNTFK